MTDKGWKFCGNERKYIDEVLKNGFGASETGTMNERLEKKFAEIHDKQFAITANSGTSTLHMALYSFGVGPGDEVIIPSLTVGMCGFAVWQSGATPIFVDVLPDTFLMDPADVKSKISEKTKAIMPVHMYGNMCDMEKIMKISTENNLFVVEDLQKRLMLFTTNQKDES
jgi:perosamine synthetase